MKLFHDYKAISFHAFWSRDTSKVINEVLNKKSKSYATHHDIFLRFLNDKLFKGQGVLNREFRRKGKTYPDLLIPSKTEGKEHEIIELRTHTSELKYLRLELNKREKIFAFSDYLYFAYFLRRVWKEKNEILKVHDCIYYLVIISIPKKTEKIPINELEAVIKMGAEDFNKKVAEESGIDSEREELLGVDNIFKAVDLERRLEEKGKQLKEKEDLIKEKEKQLKEKEKEIKQLKKQLDETRK
ncbi:hypothetical protein LCGC14_1162300 [marine sediment metagenome]|uniref:Uncharacterized protein n=1 Tax=marine sediment metagenome TaxID=412755 RepID=A0A0F9LS50_9ZZZZ